MENKQEAVDRQDLETTIASIVGEVLGLETKYLNNTKSLTNSYDMDSLDYCEITLKIEKTFDIIISDEDAFHLNELGRVTVESLTDYVFERLN